MRKLIERFLGRGEEIEYGYSYEKKRNDGRYYYIMSHINAFDDYIMDIARSTSASRLIPVPNAWISIYQLELFLLLHKLNVRPLP